MNIKYTNYKPEYYNFLREMLYEAVYWRRNSQTPGLIEGLADPAIIRALEDWSCREGDIAVIALEKCKPVGAAWIRYWTNDNNIRGYYDDRVPVLVIGVHESYRKKGIGGKLIENLCEKAIKNNIRKISLCVSKDNHALKLYRNKGFKVLDETEDSYLMEKELLI